MDIDRIPLGTDYRDHIRNTLQRSDILLAVIGPQWLAVEKETGQPRIADETDWVRIEIETALGKKIPVIPVLIDRARLPKPSELPESVRDFAYRQAADIDAGVDFRSHMERLIRSMDQLLDHQSRPTKPNVEPQGSKSAPLSQEGGQQSPEGSHPDDFERLTVASSKPIKQNVEPVTVDDRALPPGSLDGHTKWVNPNFQIASAIPGQTSDQRPVLEVAPAWTYGVVSGLVSSFILYVVATLTFNAAIDRAKLTTVFLPILLVSCFGAALVAVFLDRNAGRRAAIPFVMFGVLMGVGTLLSAVFFRGLPPTTADALMIVLFSGGIWSATTACAYWILMRTFGGPKLRLF